MGRPIASEHNKKIGLTFANIVTEKVPGKGSHSIIDRAGKYSIFRALSICCPASVRNEDPYVGRHGMTEIEFNKHLEKNGFVKMRTRSPYSEDWEDTEDCRNVQGIRYFYTGRRWRNPADKHDLEILEQGWKECLAPSTALKLDHFLNVCMEFHNEWNKLTSRKRMSSLTSSECSPNKKLRTHSPISDLSSNCGETQSELEEEAIFYLNAKQEFEVGNKVEYDSFVLTSETSGVSDEIEMHLSEVEGLNAETLHMIEPVTRDPALCQSMSTKRSRSIATGQIGQADNNTSLVDFINNHEEMVGKLEENDILRIISDLDADF
ncbi:hypothetical protein GUITHDRAFT_99780 [Guillardia theta CCMP2712]|uniref:Uncharacterized protein n=1 Tax=Guillardia theta (strain CCMP2712) TaxID=905079 RepID=L1K1S7_GUITC|nr:hypothetical protein GUITHDRAFT_99780 [Guillardia theta CCMP2712]EKX54303.1 hypothetical protein GUITHDRAFT_99780 [Guillardia theta CCMP2712]|eukprot:XP_005841283.1 hypothetical protein GUITHDRAFT_99780 [Guillardia theta CCMP2712]